MAVSNTMVELHLDLKERTSVAKGLHCLEVIPLECVKPMEPGLGMSRNA